MIYIFYVKRTHRVLIVRESDNVYSNDRETKTMKRRRCRELARKVKEKLQEIYINLYSRIKKSSLDLINFRNLELD